MLVINTSYKKTYKRFPAQTTTAVYEHTSVRPISSWDSTVAEASCDACVSFSATGSRINSLRLHSPPDSLEMTATVMVVLLSVRARAAASSGGGNCDGGSGAPSVAPAGGRTSAVPLVRLRPGPHTPWTVGPGSAPAFSPHSWLPARMPGLQGQGGEGLMNKPIWPIDVSTKLLCEGSWAAVKHDSTW